MSGLMIAAAGMSPNKSAFAPEISDLIPFRPFPAKTGMWRECRRVGSKSFREKKKRCVMQAEHRRCIVNSKEGGKRAQNPKSVGWREGSETERRRRRTT